MALIYELEDLLSEQDADKLKDLRELIKTHAQADIERILDAVDDYITTRSAESRDAIQRIIESLKNS